MAYIVPARIFCRFVTGAQPAAKQAAPMPDGAQQRRMVEKDVEEQCKPLFTIRSRCMHLTALFFG
jgi:hypothetical protein